MKKWIYLIISIIIFLSIWWFSSLDATESSGQSNELIIRLRLMTEEEMLNDPERAQMYSVIVRKTAHFLMYFILGTFIFLTLAEFSEAYGFSFLAGWILTIILAGVDEYHQSFVPGRSMELRDVLIDAGGAFLGILIVYSFYRSIDKRRNKRRIYYYGR